MSSYLLESLLFIVLGIGLFFLSLSLLNLFFHGKMKHEIIVDQNNALAIVVASFTIGIAIIIASAIVG